ncbi:HAD-SF-IA-v3: HAD hydrolase, family IA, variant 3 [compost metagenome]
MSARAFWTVMGVDPSLEDEYLAGHQLQTDLMWFVHLLPSTLRLACLSNDVSEWSEKLRRQFSLEALIPHWTISGDVGYRKPDARIYDLAVAQLALPPERILFVDDRLANVRAARAQGLRAVLFDTGGESADEPAYTFAALMDALDAVRARDGA